MERGLGVEPSLSELPLLSGLYRQHSHLSWFSTAHLILSDI